MPVDDVREILGNVAIDNDAEVDVNVGDLVDSCRGDFRSGNRNDPPDKIPALLNFFPNLLCFFSVVVVVWPTSLSSFDAIVTFSVARKRTITGKTFVSSQ